VIDWLDIFEKPAPVCPHCGHEMTDDEMGKNQYTDGDDGDDLWALAPEEGRTKVVCPHVLCEKPYFVRGSYKPQYTSAINEDDL
jgi:hypothetical protein